jgi:hypothetical protein
MCIEYKRDSTTKTIGNCLVGREAGDAGTPGRDAPSVREVSPFRTESTPTRPLFGPTRGQTRQVLLGQEPRSWYGLVHTPSFCV